jgi:hypothetical protein
MVTDLNIKPKRSDAVNVRGETGRAEGRQASFSAKFRFHRDAHPRHLRFRRVAEAE